jgi:nucleotide-binding universal stress UspA family protein
MQEIDRTVSTGTQPEAGLPHAPRDGRVLVALDGSPFAEAAIPVALGLARSIGADIELVTVCDAAPGSHNLSGSSTQEHALEREQHARQHHDAVHSLNAVRARIARLPGAPTVTTTVLSGVPAEQILAQAQTSGARVLVVTTHGRGGLARQWIGSVTDALVRHATQPVVTVRPPHHDDAPAADAAPSASWSDWSLRTLLVSLDGTPSSESVLDPLRALLAVPVAYVLMRAIVPPPAAQRALVGEHAAEAELAMQGARATEHLTAVQARLHRHGLHATGCTHYHAAPAHAILDCAREHHVDLIAMATHGRGGIGRLMLGSVADKVLRTADRPVLLYRNPAQDTA